jgi:hypothetical protein
MQHVRPADAGRSTQPHFTLAPGLLTAHFLGHHSVKLEKAGIGARAAPALGPVEHLCGRVDLVVVPAFRA